MVPSIRPAFLQIATQLSVFGTHLHELCAQIIVRDVQDCRAETRTAIINWKHNYKNMVHLHCPTRTEPNGNSHLVPLTPAICNRLTIV